MELGLEVPLNILFFSMKNLQGATKYNHPCGGGWQAFCMPRTSYIDSTFEGVPPLY